MNIKNIKRENPFLTKSFIKFVLSHNSYKTERGLRNYLAKCNDEEKSKCEAPFVYRLEINVTWRKSIWGWCPRAEARWNDDDGWHYDRNAGYASGCGYDKHSAAVAEVCNKILTRNAYLKRRKLCKSTKEGNAPYGLCMHANTLVPSFEGGIGMSSYYFIMEFLGGKLEHIAEGKTYDKWVIEFKNPPKQA